MSMVGGSELISIAASVIKRAATEQGHEAHKAERRKCGNCGKPEEPEKEKFARCASCLQIRYCSRSCQGKDHVFIIGDAFLSIERNSWISSTVRLQTLTCVYFYPLL